MIHMYDINEELKITHVRVTKVDHKLMRLALYKQSSP
jgi:hypothetical protein